jgi:hypothetical protein
VLGLFQELYELRCSVCGQIVKENSECVVTLFDRYKAQKM